MRAWSEGAAVFPVRRVFRQTGEGTGLILALSGFAMVISFMVLIMSKRLSAVTALSLVPLIFAVFLGAGSEVGQHIMDGMVQVAPTAVMLMFAILYFGIMIDVGLFDPLVDRIVRWVENDPLKVTLGHMALATIVGLDGDGTTTILVTASAMLPIYRRLGMRPMIYALLGSMAGTLTNLIPWGGPSARVAAALKVNLVDLFVPLIPSILIGLVAAFGVAWYYGLRERKRLGRTGPEITNQSELVEDALQKFERDPAARRPKLILVNLALTLALMTCVILHVAPLPVVFMLAFAAALLINYPKVDDQRKRLIAHAPNVITMATMVLAAGAFTGVLSGTGMVDAMARSVVAVVPEPLGPYMAVITALLSLPMTFFLSNDAFYFGILPILAEAGQTYGISPEEMGRASMLGQPVHGLSPLIASLYLKCAIVGIDVADYQRFAMKWMIALSLVVIVAAMLTLAIPVF
jgi:CitMHS family citrate-Mg2+:H+ or citrate-Ca2+:H+ symporter